MHREDREDDAAKVLDGLRRIVRDLRRTAHGVEQKLGIGGAQLFVLRELAEEPGISIRRLSERTLTDPSSVSVVVARLVAAGLILRRKDPDDARRSVLVLSARGKRALRAAPEPFQARLVGALRALPRARLRRLAVELSAIVAALGADGGVAPMFFDEGPKRRKRRGS